MMSTPSLWLASSYRDTASPSLESIEDEKYLASATEALPWVGLKHRLHCMLSEAAGRRNRILHLAAESLGLQEQIQMPPDTMTKSPGFAPFLVGTLNLGKPIMVQSITSSPASFVSPPTILTPNSFDAIAKPSASPFNICRRRGAAFGMPSEIAAMWSDTLGSEIAYA